VVDNARFKCGVNHIEVYLDSVLVFKQNIERLNLTQGRSIYTVLDFRKMLADGNRFYKLYQDDGNTLNFYSQSPGNGKLRIKGTNQSNVRIVMQDFHGNTSTVRFRLKPGEPQREIITLETPKADVTSDIQDNTLVISSRMCESEEYGAQAYVTGEPVELEPSYFNASKNVFLIDLRKIIPDSVVVCGQSIVTNLKAMVPSGTEYKYYSDLMDIRFPDRALYDTLYLTAAHTLSMDSLEIFSLGPQEPFNRSITVTLKPTQAYARDKTTGVYRVYGRTYGYEGGEWANGKITFYPRELGDFTILTDTVPPVITRIYANTHGTRFRIGDNLSGIASFEATLNGKWLLMNYDAKTGILVSEKLDPNVPLAGDFELTVTDQAGNKKTYTQKIQ
jgi:hypothetical protein